LPKHEQLRVLEEVGHRVQINRQTFSDKDVQKYVGAWSKPGALTASINYHRANLNPAQILMMSKEQQQGLAKRFSKVKCPTLVIWGEDDAALDKSLSVGLEKYVKGTYEIRYI
jgi:pimeloyl-ACP methyl ester carboxylesterase